jgi:predicted dehydrogenase
MVASAARNATVLMVGYMKRYDPAFERFATLLGAGDDVRLIRVTTLESAPDEYVSHYPLARAHDVSRSALAVLEQDDRTRVARALGDHDELVYGAYRFGLLDSLVHELNMLRALFGEPASVHSAHFWREGAGVQTAMCFGTAECQLAWVQLPGIARFEQEVAVHTPDRRLTLSFPSPFLRNMPTRIIEVSGEPDTASSWRREEVVGYDEPFRRELEAFHRAVTEGEQPRTDGIDGTRDVALCQAIVRSFVTGVPVADPTVLAGDFRLVRQETKERCNATPPIAKERA